MRRKPDATKQTEREASAERGLPAEARPNGEMACQPKLVRTVTGLPAEARPNGDWLASRSSPEGRAKAGGSAWESNPASPRERGATDFEDREDHRAPFASMSVAQSLDLRAMDVMSV
jgi:hypothetical protein